MFAYETLTARSEIDSVRPAWLELTNGSFARPFIQPAWFEAWSSAFPTHPLTLFTARYQSRLVAVIPLAKAMGTLPNLFVPFIAPPARGDYQPLVVDPAYAGEVVPRLLDTVLKHYRSYSTFLLPHLPLTDPALPAIRDWIVQRGLPSAEATETAPRLALHGMTYEELERSWPPKQREEVRRRFRRLSELGEVSLWIPESLEEALPVLEEFFDVHDQKWISQNQPGRFQDRRQREHFRQILIQLWNSGALFTTMRCGSINVSFHFGFLADGWIQCFRRTYRLDYHKYSPGMLHLTMLAQQVAQNGGQGLDFLMGEEPYKYRWANESFTATDVLFARSASAIPYLWLTKGKPATKRRAGRLYANLQVALQKLRRGSATASFSDKASDD
jgi:CelD/BcsL family acetyltransferase involved in cellulose biosynthesis